MGVRFFSEWLLAFFLVVLRWMVGVESSEDSA